MTKEQFKNELVGNNDIIPELIPIALLYVQSFFQRYSKSAKIGINKVKITESSMRKVVIRFCQDITKGCGKNNNLTENDRYMAIMINYQRYFIGALPKHSKQDMVVVVRKTFEEMITHENIRNIQEKGIIPFCGIGYYHRAMNLYRRMIRQTKKDIENQQIVIDQITTNNNSLTATINDLSKQRQIVYDLNAEFEKFLKISITGQNGTALMTNWMTIQKLATDIINIMAKNV